MIGNTLKSKINGNLFQVTEIFTENDHQYYKVLDLATGRLFTIGKETFEKSVMLNLEIVKEKKNRIKY